MNALVENAKVRTRCKQQDQCPMEKRTSIPSSNIRVSISNPTPPNTIPTFSNLAPSQKPQRNIHPPTPQVLRTILTQKVNTRRTTHPAI
jgi:hypothetical protein